MPSITLVQTSASGAVKLDSNASKSFIWLDHLVRQSPTNNTQERIAGYFLRAGRTLSTWAISSEAVIPKIGQIRKSTSRVGDLWPFSNWDSPR